MTDGPTTEHAHTERQIPEYYRNLGQWSIDETIKDLDHAPNLDDFNRKLSNSKSKNFIVDFSDEEAYCGFNLDAEAYTALLHVPRPPELNTRWINLWLPYEQKDILKALAENYGFTPRLLGFMKASPIKVARTPPLQSENFSFSSIFRRSRDGNGHGNGNGYGHGSSGKLSSQISMVPGFDDDAEEKIGLTTPWWVNTSQPDFNEALSPYALANEIWHYSSVDWGRRYVSLGYNTVHNVPAVKDEFLLEDETYLDRPHGRRLWTWLILCEDKTVITINEDPFPHRHNGNGGSCLNQYEQFCLDIIRRNLRNTFGQCSKARHGPNEPAQLQLPLRTRLGDAEEETLHRPADTPGLLFYYLFDDWFNSYGLIARREHRYRVELNELRKCMLHKAELSHVDKLHHIGRQLAVLTRIYESYEFLIDRVLEKHEPTLASLKNSHVLQSYQGSRRNSAAIASPIYSPTPNEQVLLADPTELIGVSISSAARVRFSQHKHRIRAYAITGLSECQSQKESLVLMNFNLIAIKESTSVERLTVITLLLTKIAVIFMPVSLMTAYFSCQFEGVEYREKTYWAWFGGTVGLTLAGLGLFSAVSGTLEWSVVLRPVREKVMQLSASFGERRRRSRVTAAEL